MVQVDSINDLPGYNEPKPGYSELITKTVLKIAIKIANNAKKKKSKFCLFQLKS
jgi:hypothetical protein